MSFIDELKNQFDGDYKINYHMAPPIFSFKRDSRGRVVKKSFGQWLGKTMKILEKFKILRGTAFDPFGYGSERREEISLIRWFEEALTSIGKQYRPENIDLCRIILSSPLEMRGFGPVKKSAIIKGLNDADHALSKLNA